MDLTLLVIFYLGFSLFMANLPWGSNRLLGLWALRGKHKGTWLRLLEWLLLALLCGGVGFLLEFQFSGQLHPKSGEFYFICGLLFAVFAVPSFIYRQVYLPFMTTGIENRPGEIAPGEIAKKKGGPSPEKDEKASSQ